MKLDEVLKLADKISRQVGVPSHIVKAIIMTESGGDPAAETPYARGLMGVSESAMIDVSRTLHFPVKYAHLFDPQTNIFVGANYLKILKKAWERWLITSAQPDDLRTAVPLVFVFMIMSYNWGIGNVKNWLDKTPPDNSKIDEAVPDETLRHLIDVAWWARFFLDRREKKLVEEV